MGTAHNYLRCAGVGCGRLDREDYIRQRFLTTSVGCRHCGSQRFFDTFLISSQEADLVRRGRFADSDTDPYEDS